MYNPNILDPSYDKLYSYKNMILIDVFTGVAHLHGYKLEETLPFNKKFGFSLLPPEQNMRLFYFYADNETDMKRYVYLSGLVSSVGRALASKLRGPGFKSRSGTVGGPVTMIMWGARPSWKLALS